MDCKENETQRLEACPSHEVRSAKFTTSSFDDIAQVKCLSCPIVKVRSLKLKPFNTDNRGPATVLCT